MIKNKYEEFKRKTANMTFKEKLIDYIWEYYKMHIIGSILAIAATISIIHSITSQKDTFISIAFYGEFVSPITLENIENNISNGLNVDTSQETVNAILFHMDEEDPTLRYSQINKFFAMLTVSELDILITDSTHFHYLSEEDVFYPLNELFSAEEFGLIEDYIIYSNYGVPVGINLDKVTTSFFHDNTYTRTDSAMGVIINSERIEATRDVLNFILH